MDCMLPDHAACTGWPYLFVAPFIGLFADVKAVP